MSNNHISRRDLLRATGTGFVLLTVGTTSVIADEDDQKEAAIDHVADKKQERHANLSVIHTSREAYPESERSLYLAKVYNSDKHEVTTVRLNGDQKVIPRKDAIRNEEQSYRHRYGKLGRELFSELENASSSETFRVFVQSTNRIDRSAARRTVGQTRDNDSDHVREELAAENNKRLRQHCTDLQKQVVQKSDVEIDEEMASLPGIVVQGTRSQIEELEQIGRIRKISLARNNPVSTATYDESAPGRRTIRTGREYPTKYDATGLVAGVLELEMPDTTEHYNEKYTDYDGTDHANDGSSSSTHANAVSEVVASYSSRLPGAAYNADIFQADDPIGESRFNNLIEEISQYAAAINNSWANDTDGRTVNSNDDHVNQAVLNNLVSIVFSAGNIGGEDDTHWISSPARGFNQLTIGGTWHNQNDEWGDDTIYESSKYANPETQSSDPNTNDYPLFKPEVSAPGENIQVPSSAVARTGTSFAAPHVTGVITLLQRFARESTGQDIRKYPSVHKSIIMASAQQDDIDESHFEWDRIENYDTRWPMNGAGSISAEAARDIVHEDWFISDLYELANTSQSYSISLRKGEEVSLYLTWLCERAEFLGGNTTDIDLDLEIETPNGTTRTASGVDRGFRELTFTATETGQYTVRVMNSQWYSYDDQREMGIAWYRKPEVEEWTQTGGDMFNSNHNAATEEVTASGYDLYKVWDTSVTSLFNCDPIVGDGIVFAPDTYQGRLFAVDAIDGQRLWDYQTDGEFEYGGVVYRDGTVYALGTDGLLTALDMSGNILWDTYLPVSSSEPGLAIVGSRLYASSGDLYAIDRQTGDIHWSRRFSKGVRGTPAIDYAPSGAYDLEHHIYVTEDIPSTNDPLGVLHRVYPDGSKKWSVDIPYGAAIKNAPVVGKDSIIVPSSGHNSLNGGAAAFNKADGSLKWDYQANGEVYGSLALAHSSRTYDISTEYVYFGACFTGNDGELYQLDGRTGEEIAVETALGRNDDYPVGDIYSGPFLSEDYLHVTDRSGNLIRTSRDDISEDSVSITSISSSDGFTSSPVVVENRVYMLINGRIVCYSD